MKRNSGNISGNKMMRQSAATMTIRIDLFILLFIFDSVDLDVGLP